MTIINRRTEVQLQRRGPKFTRFTPGNEYTQLRANIHHTHLIQFSRFHGSLEVTELYWVAVTLPRPDTKNLGFEYSSCRKNEV